LVAAAVEETLGGIRAIKIPNHHQRNPQIVVQAGLSAGKSARSHADNFKLMTINLDGLAYDRGVGTEMRLPELIANDRDRGAAGLITFRGQETAAEDGPDSESTKIVRGGQNSPNTLGFAFMGNAHGRGESSEKV
jgi:hypothetical protein